MDGAEHRDGVATRWRCLNTKTKGLTPRVVTMCGKDRRNGVSQRGIIADLARITAALAATALASQVVVSFLGAIYTIGYTRGMPYHAEMSTLLLLLALLLLAISIASMSTIYKPGAKWGIRLGEPPGTIIGLLVFSLAILAANLISVATWVRSWLDPIPPWLFGLWFSPPVLLCMAQRDESRRSSFGPSS